MQITPTAQEQKGVYQSIQRGVMRVGAVNFNPGTALVNTVNPDKCYLRLWLHNDNTLSALPVQAEHEITENQITVYGVYDNNQVINWSDSTDTVLSGASQLENVVWELYEYA